MIAHCILDSLECFVNTCSRLLFCDSFRFYQAFVTVGNHSFEALIKRDYFVEIRLFGIFYALKEVYGEVFWASVIWKGRVWICVCGVTMFHMRQRLEEVATFRMSDMAGRRVTVAGTKKMELVFLVDIQVHLIGCGWPADQVRGSWVWTRISTC